VSLQRGAASAGDMAALENGITFLSKKAGKFFDTGI